jgi:hypothetical protein
VPTYAELDREVWWGREYAPPTLAFLAHSVRTYFGLASGAVGIKGDNRHLRGYHRSRAWIQNSRYCTNRVYSVSRTPGDRHGGDPNWLSALDVSAPPRILLPMCRRLDTAVRSGRLEKVTEWYGNMDGDTRVDGYDNIANRLAASDSSHLYHLHASLDRGRAGETHLDLYLILTGQEATMSDSKAAHGAFLQTRAMYQMLEKFWTYDADSFTHPDGSVEVPNPLATTLKNLARDVHQLAQRPQVDPQALAQALVNDSAAMTVIANAIAGRIGTLPTPEVIAEAVLDEQHRRSEN